MIYVTVTGLSLPGAALITLAAGAIFGLLWGTLIVSFALTIGATLAFLISRFLLQYWVQTKFSRRLEAVNESVTREGVFLSCHTSIGARVCVLRDQFGHGTDADAHLDFLLGQSTRHAGWHPGLCQCQQIRAESYQLLDKGCLTDAN